MSAEGLVPDRLIVDLNADGRVSVATWLEGELPAAPTPPAALDWPLDEEAIESLRWYLEDYLRAPFGVYGERGPTVAAKLRDWGEAIFSAVFASAEPREAYVRLRARAEAGMQIVFRSAAPGLLALPWELLCDPQRATPVALDLVGVARTLPAGVGEAFAAGGERLRVLMVISRPSGAADVGYRMIARRMLNRLEAVRGRVELVVLRPPTLEELGRTLAAARAEGQPFQVVHFDGHGVLERRPAVAELDRSVTFDAVAGEGMLAFEKPDGGTDDVPASEVAQVLKEGQVPLVVLNACQSGAVGKDLEAAVATRLLQEGVASVVAMAYSVYAVAAAEFMAAFYERLFAGDGVTEAVTAGRRRLHTRNERPSPKGKLPLEDWVVPVHYLRRDVRFPYLHSQQSREVDLDELLDQIRGGPSGAGDVLDPTGSFVGRDALFYELEVATRLQRVVLLHGPGGTGKTELAKAFGRWWRDTGGVDSPQWVIFHSFEPGVASFGLDGVLTEVGLRIFGPDFGRLSAEERRRAVDEVLRTRRVLLIWDNFESVFTMPDPTGATPALPEDAREELREFLERVAAAGRSSIIVTSRSPEDWLGGIRRIEVGGLTPDESVEYADALLAAYPSATPRRSTEAFPELLEWLDGHPLSMRLVLPHLADTDARHLLDGLQGVRELPGALTAPGERSTSLAASVAYSFEHLDPEKARLLVAVSLFHGVADADVLGAMSRAGAVPDRFAGVDEKRWDEVLDAAAEVGLLAPMGSGLYEIHPALPAYLAAAWRDESRDDYPEEAGAALVALLTAYAAFGEWLLIQILRGDAELAYALIGRQRRTIGHLLEYAIETERWREAIQLAQPLDEYLDARGLHHEAAAWTDRARLALETPDGTPPSIETDAGALWIFVVGAQANREITAQHLASAERTYGELLAMLESQSPSDVQQSRLAVTYHQLGTVAINRGQLTAAEDLFEKAIAIRQEADEQDLLATDYHQLGIIAFRRGLLGDAEEWWRKALALADASGAESTAAGANFQLGLAAQLRSRWDEAERRYREALAIFTRQGALGKIATCYHQLGILAHVRRQLDAAESLYEQALVLKERLGDPAATAATYGQLGLLARDRGRNAEALEWLVKSANALDAFPHPAIAPAPRNIARVTLTLGMPALERCWRKVTGADLPADARALIEAEMAALEKSNEEGP